MSPEQIQGTDADHRSDIFSLGVVLYELFTGELPFKGVHETALVYEIVNVDPVPMASINPELNPELDRIVFECLQKDADERFQSVKDISKELKRYKRESSRQRATRTMSTRQFPKMPGSEGAGSGSGVMQPAPEHGGESPVSPSAVVGRSKGRFLWPVLSVVLLIALVYSAFNRQGAQSGGETPVMRFPVTLSVSSPLVLGAATLAIAPDGGNFVYLAGDAAAPLLYLRPMDRLTATPMASTEGASDPFFSADGKWVGFYSAGKLKKVSIFGGASQDICEVPGFMRGGCWSADGSIFFGHLNRGVFRVAAAGERPPKSPRSTPRAGKSATGSPRPFRAVKWVVYTVKFNNIATFDDAVIVAENVETHERRELIRGGSYARYLASGHLMYARGTSLFAIPFDALDVRVTGAPLPVVDGGMLNPFSGTANFEVSNNGILIYTPLGPAGHQQRHHRVDGSPGEHLRHHPREQAVRQPQALARREQDRADVARRERRHLGVRHPTSGAEPAHLRRRQQRSRSLDAGREGRHLQLRAGKGNRPVQAGLGRQRWRGRSRCRPSPERGHGPVDHAGRLADRLRQRRRHPADGNLRREALRARWWVRPRSRTVPSSRRTAGSSRIGRTSRGKTRSMRSPTPASGESGRYRPAERLHPRSGAVREPSSSSRTRVS